VALIDSKYLTAHTSVSPQHDARKVNIAIQQAELFYVTPLIGAHRKAILEGGGELLQEWGQLLLLVKPYHALAAHYELLLDTMVDTVAKGTLQPEDTAPLETVKLRREDLKAKMQVLRDQILAHLAAYPDQFGTATEKLFAPTQHSSLVLLETPPRYFGG
jgi:hypothetical protein